jgi:hypothetical protein
VIQAGEVLIARRTRATGSIVTAERLRLGFLTHPARLEFRFDYTTARDGQAVRLRASPVAQDSSRVVVDRAGRHHRGLQWADGGDMFEAFVDGNYEIAARPQNP